MSDYQPVDALPSLDQFLALCCVEDAGAGGGGAFPTKDSKDNQLSLTVDLSTIPIKHRIFLQHLMAGETATDAAKAAGYSPESAQQQGSRLKSKYEGGLISELMNEKGLTMEFLLGGLKEGCEAMTVKWNPAKERWDKFIDEGARTANRKIAFQLHGVMNEGEAKQPAVLVLDLGLERPALDPAKEVPAEVVGSGRADFAAAGEAVAAEASGVSQEPG